MISISQDNPIYDKTLTAIVLLDLSSFITCVHLCSYVYHALNAPERREDDESLLYHKLV